MGQVERVFIRDTVYNINPTNPPRVYSDSCRDMIRHALTCEDEGAAAEACAVVYAWLAAHVARLQNPELLK